MKRRKKNTLASSLNENSQQREGRMTESSKAGLHEELEHHIADESYEKAKYSWALGKSLGLYAENDEEVIQALVEVRKGIDNDCTLSRSSRKKGNNSGL